MGIAEHPMVHTLPKRFRNLGKHPKIHIGHPERNDIILSSLVPFHAIGVSTRNDFIEIIFHKSYRVSIKQSAGGRIFSSMVTLPMESATT